MRECEGSEAACKFRASIFHHDSVKILAQRKPALPEFGGDFATATSLYSTLDTLPNTHEVAKSVKMPRGRGSTSGNKLKMTLGLPVYVRPKK